jgi:hypothetical protein
MCFSTLPQTTPVNPAKYPLAEASKAVRSQATPVGGSARPPNTGTIPDRQSAKPGSGASLTL